MEIQLFSLPTLRKRLLTSHMPGLCLSSSQFHNHLPFSSLTLPWFRLAFPTAPNRVLHLQSSLIPCFPPVPFISTGGSSQSPAHTGVPPPEKVPDPDSQVEPREALGSRKGAQGRSTEQIWSLSSLFSPAKTSRVL